MTFDSPGPLSSLGALCTLCRALIWGWLVSKMATEMMDPAFGHGPGISERFPPSPASLVSAGDGPGAASQVLGCSAASCCTPGLLQKQRSMRISQLGTRQKCLLSDPLAMREAAARAEALAFAQEEAAPQQTASCDKKNSDTSPAVLMASRRSAVNPKRNCPLQSDVSLMKNIYPQTSFQPLLLM